MAAAAAAAAGFAALAGLVAAGTLMGLDQWAVDHAMPGAHGIGSAPTLVESVVPLLHVSWGTALEIVANVVTLPAQSVLSLVLVLGVGAVLFRRGRHEAAVAWPAALVLGTALEVVCKHALGRPPLLRGGRHVPGFDSSWPSGHTLRIVLLAATLAVAWPAARELVAVWATAGIVLLELAGDHTPSDIAGGILLAALLGLAADGVERSGLLRRRAARAGAPRARGAGTAPRGP